MFFDVVDQMLPVAVAVEGSVVAVGDASEVAADVAVESVVVTLPVVEHDDAE